MTPAGIEPTTFRFVAQHLNHCATTVPEGKVLLWIPRQGLTNLWHACPKWHAERYPWHVTFTAVPLVFLVYFAPPASLYCEYIYIYIYIYIWLRNNCIWITVATDIQIHFYTNWEIYELLPGDFPLTRQPGGDWASTWQWTKRFAIFFSSRN